MLGHGEGECWDGGRGSAGLERGRVLEQGDGECWDSGRENVGTVGGRVLGQLAGWECMKETGSMIEALRISKI